MKKILFILVAIIVCIVGYVSVKFWMIGRVSQGSPIPAYENPRKALLVIDLQKDLTEPSGKHVINLKQTDIIIENANKIIRRFADNGSLIIYIRQIHDTGPIINLFTHGALAEGTDGSKIDGRIIMVGEHILDKRIMDAFSNPELDALLTKNQINQLFITGIAADQCVDRTIKAAKNRNYKVTVISDAVGTITDEKRDIKLKEFANMGVSVISTNDYLNI